ncbi:hypothetical protein CERZMDRAFT_92489 [Cercospora zeae-maydis SCOH1-5]|uniref:Zn(2)-C6 fungal-type domain-containing protein n=1 Tax=Cercospora zeae-maydis SCOH1-5 TaxID=717836 RepID=A0A6A6FWI6_9PEZI|nr:hypothetical protein CERZMDRAFT_92489 [Cercospora zeae-maydis SCOH1-5]
MDGPSSSSRTSETDRLLQSLKRQTIPTACHNCRSKKVKCDGRLPCAYCSRRSLECSYESTLPSETPQQARKRRHQELARTTEDLKQLYDILAGEDEAKAIEVFQRIRKGDDVDSLLAYLQHGAIHQSNSAALDDVLRRLFLFNLVESTATLEEVASTSRSVLANKRVSLPSADVYENLQDRIVTLDHMSGFLTDANAAGAIEGPKPPFEENESAGPPYWVPAQPWLPNTCDKEASHLLSLFFAYPNLCWRFVEIKSFLKAMRSRDLNSRYCSPFLANAIMSIATLNADTDEEPAAAGETQKSEIGSRYHRKALQMWSGAASEPSATNIQGLSILAVDTILRGQDRQGLELLNAACALNERLHVPAFDAKLGKEEQEHFRIRGCIWWMTVHVELTFKVGLMLGGNGTDWSRAPALEQVLPDITQYWIGYPLRDEPMPFRANSLFLQQCRFTRFLWEATNILIWRASELDAHREHAIAVHNLSAQMEQWHHDLPQDLQFRAEIPPSLYDLHTQYHCVQMALHERTYMQMFGPMRDRISDAEDLVGTENEQTQAFLRTRVMQHCYEGATLIRSFRETYGLKCVSFVLLNHSMMGVFICLNDIHANPQKADGRAGSQHGPVQDTTSALEEFFRVLLATSRKWKLSRGLARSFYHTAVEELHVTLPKSISDMIQMMAGSSWQGSDLQQLGATIYPNWSMPYVRETNHVEDYRMGDMLKKWEQQPNPQGAVRQPRSSSLPSRRSSSSGTTNYDPVRDL